MKPNNKQLHSILLTLTQKAFQVYDRSIGKQSQDSDLSKSMKLFKLDKEIVELEDFKQTDSLMKSDKKISSLLGNLVGTLTSGASVSNAETCILMFIHQLYMRNSTFSRTLFDQQYETFEELFYSGTLRFIDRVRLYNFESEVDELILADGLFIKKSARIVDEQTKFQEIQLRPYIQFSSSDFVVERHYSRPKIVGEQRKPLDNDALTKETNESPDLFDGVIKTFRLLKNSGIYRDHVITTETLTFTPHAGLTSRFPFFENTVIGGKCKILKNEVDEVQQIYKNLIANGNNSFKIASSRLGFGLERRLDEDRLMDFMVGLESIYLPDGHDELTFRLSLRVAYLLSEKPTERKELFKFMKKIYNLRSKIVHGKKYNLSKDEINKVEEILRKSLKLFLASPDNFSLDEVDKHGTLIKEGKLDNFFS